MSALTPRHIVEELDKYIIGQQNAKRAVAVALSNRERRRKLDQDMRREVLPKNIILIGPTGVGKTEIARRIAGLVEAPFVKVEATKFTEVGYVGRDVDSIVSDLVESAVNATYEVELKKVEVTAEKLATERLVTYLCQQISEGRKTTGAGTRTRRKKDKLAVTATATAAASATPVTAPESRNNRQVVASLLKNRELDDQIIEIEVNEAADPIGYSMYDPEGGMDDYRLDYVEAAEGRGPDAARRRRKVSVREARRILVREEAIKLMDFGDVVDRSLRNVEDNGVVFVDELDKLVAPKIDMGRDVSGEGVQRDLLPLVEGSTIMTRYGSVKTDHILFIAAGCFYRSKPSDLLPELQGRFPLRVELNALSEADLVRILTEPKNALTRQYTALLATEGVKVEFTPDGTAEIARLACVMNQRMDNIGARRLNTITEKVMEEANFTAPERSGETITVDAAYVSNHVGDLIKDEDLSRYIL